MGSRMHEAVFYRLTDLVGIEKRLCEELVSLCESEKAAILGWRIDELKQYASEKASLMFELDRVRTQREEAVVELVESLEVEGKFRLSELFGLLEDPFSTMLQRAVSSLGSAAGRLMDLNRRNGGLLQDGVRLIEATRRLLKNVSGLPATYQATGTISISADSGRLLRGTA